MDQNDGSTNNGYTRLEDSEPLQTAIQQNETNNNLEDEEETPSVSYFKLFSFSSKKDKFFIFLAIISSILCGLSTPINTILLAMLLQSMVDYGISVLSGTPHTADLLQATYEFGVYNSILGVVVVFLTYLSTVLMNIAAYHQVYRIRKEYFKAVLIQDFEYFDTHTIGNIASKMTDDIVKLESGISEKLVTFIYYQSSFLSSIIVAMIQGWKLALLCLVSLPTTMILYGVTGWMANSLAKKESLLSNKAGAVAEEVLSSIRTVFAFNCQHKEASRYDSFAAQIRKTNVKKGFFSGLSMGLLSFCIFASYSLSFWFGYKLMLDEPEKYNTYIVTAVFFGVMMGSSNFGMSSSLIEAFGIACGAGAQVFDVISSIPSINPLLERGQIPDNIEGNIELKNVTFNYPSRPDIPVLKNVSLNVKRGQTVALVGHSGCGKSTIIQLILRFYDVCDGAVSLDGVNIKDLSVRWLRSQIGVVGQEPVLFNTTIKENIRYGREDASDMEIEEAARHANAHSFITSLPKSYETIVGERGTSLSGGQKQRIAIARALIRNPAILLLDEATSALDTASESKVQKALDKAVEGRTTIVVAHRLATIRHADMIYVLENGSIVEYGNHDSLMARQERYYEMIKLQTVFRPEGGDSDSTNGRDCEISHESHSEEDELLEAWTEAEQTEEKKLTFWQVLRLNSPEWKSITVASICSMFGGVAMPLLGVVIGDFVGSFSGEDKEQNMKDVQKYALMFVGVGIFTGVVNFFEVSLYEMAGEYLTERLRKLMFWKLLTQEVGFYDDKNHSTGALCAQLSGETAAIRGATGQRIGTILQSVGTLVLALTLALMFEWRVGLIAAAFVPIMGIIFYQEGIMTNEESIGTAQVMADSSKIAVEAASNVRTVASLGREGRFIAEYALELYPALVLAKRSTQWRGIVFGLSRGLFNFVYSASMYYGGILIAYHNVNYAVVLKSAEALMMGALSAAQCFAYAPDFQKGIHAAGRIIRFLNRQPEVTDPIKPAVESFSGSGAAALKHVKFRYPTRKDIQVLKGLDLQIKKGKVVALVGGSGCGKSTVIQLLERFYDPEEGEVAQDNMPLPKLRMAHCRKIIGFVQQEPVLFDLTIADNIAYGMNWSRRNMNSVVEAAKQANIHNFIAALPGGYDTNIGPKGTQLSGGQKQRIAIARALMLQPKMLLLDEATSALDTESEKVVQDALDAAKAGRTCVVIAHRLSTIRDADIIYVLNDGRVAETGKHQELLDLKGLYYNLYSRDSA